MYCGNCGVKLQDNENFCTGCGEKIRLASNGDAAQPVLIEEADRIFVYQNIYPIVILYSGLSFLEDKFDAFDYLAGMLGGFIEIAILHFIIFYLWGRLKNTLLLTLAIGLNVLVVMMQVGGTIFDLDSFIQLGASSIDLDVEDSDSLRLVSIFDYLGLSLLIIEIGCLMHIRKRFLQRKQ